MSIVCVCWGVKKRVENQMWTFSNNHLATYKNKNKKSYKFKESDQVTEKELKIRK